MASVSMLDIGKVNPVSGPIHVEVAEPGDALNVAIGNLAPSGRDWTTNIPGFGSLRANESETVDCLKFTLVCAGE